MGPSLSECELSTVSTHFGKEVSYSKNWVFYSETLWKDRWDQILSLGNDLEFIESEWLGLCEGERAEQQSSRGTTMEVRTG